MSDSRKVRRVVYVNWNVIVHNYFNNRYFETIF